MSDQMRFAQLSGDHNPLHIDPDWASTRYPGQVVVHGIHVVLWALDATVTQEHISGMDVTFIKPVLVGDEVTALFDEANLNLMAFVRGEPVVRIKMRGAGSESGAVSPPLVSNDSTPFVGQTGSVLLPEEASQFSNEFAGAVRMLGRDRVKALAALSTLVGMKCPGVGGMFSGFSISFDEGDSQLSYRVSRFDERFSQITMQVTGCGVKGEVFAYAEPQGSQELDTLDQVNAGEFAGQRPWIIGGSSGLGRVAALLLAAGGATPTITYRRSVNEARAIANQIDALGGQCDLLQFDVEKCDESLKNVEPQNLNVGQLYYFASPRIFRRRLEIYQADDAHEFMRVYVDGFYELVRTIMERCQPQVLTVLYPSSSAIDENVPDLFEYSMAKQFGELVCAKLQRKYRNLAIHVARFPRVATRQTQSFLKVPAARPEDILLPYIREVQRGK